MKIYLDMDGTLVDFVSQVNKCGFWRKDKENKVDWKKVKAMGTLFWSEMNWMPGAEDAFKKIQELESQGKIELFILSSIDFEEGREGKKQWIQQNTNLPLNKVIFVLEPEDKAQYADSDTILVDDRQKSLGPFEAAGGIIIPFTGDWEIALQNIEYYIQDKMKFRFEKQKEIKELFVNLNPVIHKEEEEIKYWFPIPDDFAIELKNPYTNELEDSVNIWFTDIMKDTFTLEFSNFYQDYQINESGYQQFLKDLNNLFDNKMCILAGFVQRKMQKNQKKPSYQEVLRISSNTVFTTESNKQEIFDEFEPFKDKFPNISKVTITYWDPSLNFSVKL